jgi:hypothetical protein
VPEDRRSTDVYDVDTPALGIIFLEAEQGMDLELQADGTSQDLSNGVCVVVCVIAGALVKNFLKLSQKVIFEKVWVILRRPDPLQSEGMLG